MRILLLSVDFAPHTDGVSTLSYHYARRLAELGHDVHVVGPRSEGDRDFDASAPFGVSRFRGYAWGVLRFLPFVVCAFAALRRFRPDVVLPMNIGYGGLLCGVLAPFSRRRYVMFAYAYEFLKFRRRPFMRRVYNAIYRRSAGVVAISRYARDRLAAFGVPLQHIHLINPGVVMQANASRDQSPAGATIGTCGRLIRRKGHDLVIRALPRLAETFPRITYRIAGGGPERERLGALARELGVAERVAFLGRLSEGDLGAFYGALDVFVMPSREDLRSGHAEGFGIVFLEAAGHGVPSVGTRTGGIPEAIEDGVTGRLVSSDSVDELVETLAEMLSDPERTAALGRAARERASRDFAWDDVVDRFDELLNRLLKGDAAPAVEPRDADVGLRVAVLTRTGRESGTRLARAIAQSRHVLCGVLAERRSTMIRRMLRRHGLASVMRTHGMVFLFSRLRGVGGRGKPSDHRVPVMPLKVVKSLNSDEAVGVLQKWKVDLIVVANAPILKPPVLACAPRGAVNFHSGRLPEYGGLASEFWALHEGEREAWVTLHRVAEQLDSGEILAERPVSVREGETPETLHTKCVVAAEGMIVEILDRFAEGEPEVLRVPGPAVLRPWPTPAQRRELRRRPESPV